jgi:two-component system response regulator
MLTHVRLVPILLVEDNEDHVILIKKALRDNGLVNDIRVVTSGEAALDYLSRAGEYADPASSPRPGLVLLDLKLPGIDGIEVLKTIKQDARLRLIPVVMLTTSASESEVVASYNYGANSYIQKPVDFAKFVNTVRSLHMYWLLLNTPPPALQ